MWLPSVTWCHGAAKKGPPRIATDNQAHQEISHTHPQLGLAAKPFMTQDAELVTMAVPHWIDPMRSVASQSHILFGKIQQHVQ